jgi:hypothetical protein
LSLIAFLIINFFDILSNPSGEKAFGICPALWVDVRNTFSNSFRLISKVMIRTTLIFGCSSLALLAR